MSNFITLNRFIEAKGQTFFETVTSMGYEGIMAKRMDSPTFPGKRSDSWMKMKPQKSAICNVIGYTKGEGSRTLLGAPIIGEVRENRMIDRGRVGSGISTKTLGDLLGLLRPSTEKNGVTWVDPTLQIKVNLSTPWRAERFTLSRAWFRAVEWVTYFEETEGGHFRFPVFKRIVG